MRHLGSLSAWLCASIIVCGCGRSHLGLEDSVPGFHDSDGVQGSGSSGAGSQADPPAGTAGDASVGVAGASGGAVGGAPWVDPPSRPGTDPPVGSGPPVVPIAGAAGSAMPPSAAGAGGSWGEPDNPDASDVLNPQRCATTEPFVLSIDPGGATGEVSGWLESAPSVAFDAHDLPRFGVQTDPETQPDGDLTLWWSIASLGGGDDSLWFYTLNGATEVAYVPVTSPADIGDAHAWMYSAWSVGPVLVGELAVFHHVPSDRFIAMQVLDIYGTDPAHEDDSLCAAVRARWYVAPRGTGDFSRFR